MKNKRRSIEFDPEMVRTWVAESRRRQGLPPELNDPVIIARLVEILLSHRRAEASRSAAMARVSSR